MESENLIKEKDDIYWERNRLAAILARVFPSYLRMSLTAEEWSCVYINLPSGQISFHIPENEIIQFIGLERNAPIEWDGHSDEEKWKRTLKFISQYYQDKNNEL